MLDVLHRHQHQFYDFLVNITGYILVFAIDSYVFSELQYNLPTLSLLAFALYFQTMRLIVRRAGKTTLFGGFANGSVAYCLFLSLFTWVAYTIFIRWQRFK